MVINDIQLHQNYHSPLKIVPLRRTVTESPVSFSAFFKVISKLVILGIVFHFTNKKLRHSYLGSWFSRLPSSCHLGSPEPCENLIGSVESQGVSPLLLLMPVLLWIKVYCKHIPPPTVTIQTLERLCLDKRRRKSKALGAEEEQTLVWGTSRGDGGIFKPGSRSSFRRGSGG